jgi:hypothetical protein
MQPKIPIDPLLDEMLDEEAADARDGSQHGKRAQQHQEERRAQFNKWVHRSAARLCRGEQRAITPNDEDAVRQLTQPLVQGRVRPGATNEVSLTSEPAPAKLPHTALQIGQPRVSRSRVSYEELISKGLAGTEFERLPARNNKPLSVRLLRSPRRPHGGHDWGIAAAEAAAATADAALRILPEDPVQAYFKMEKIARDERLKKRLLKNAVLKTAGTEVAAGLPEHVDAPCRAPAKSAISSDAGVQDPELLQQKVHPMKREACQLLRFFILGEPPPAFVSAVIASLGNTRTTQKDKAQGGAEKLRTQAREKASYDPCGTKDQVRQLHAFWDNLDVDGSGSLELVKFGRAMERMFTGPPMPQVQMRRPSKSSVQSNTAGIGTEELQQPTALAALRSSPEHVTRLVSKLCDKISLAHAVDYRTEIAIEDLMRWVWPCAGEQELQTMHAWYDDFARRSSRWCVATPDVCPPCKMEELAAVFRFTDKHGRGKVSLEELMNQGLLHRDMQKKQPGSLVDLDEKAFCALLCPTGYRADSRAETGTTKEGERVRLDHRLGCWRVEESG